MKLIFYCALFALLVETIFASVAVRHSLNGEGHHCHDDDYTCEVGCHCTECSKHDDECCTDSSKTNCVALGPGKNGEDCDGCCPPGYLYCEPVPNPSCTAGQNVCPPPSFCCSSTSCTASTGCCLAGTTCQPCDFLHQICIPFSEKCYDGKGGSEASFINGIISCCPDCESCSPCGPNQQLCSANSKSCCRTGGLSCISEPIDNCCPDSSPCSDCQPGDSKCFDDKTSCCPEDGSCETPCSSNSVNGEHCCSSGSLITLCSTCSAGSLLCPFGANACCNTVSGKTLCDLTPEIVDGLVCCPYGTSCNEATITPTCPLED